MVSLARDPRVREALLDQAQRATWGERQLEQGGL